MTPLIRLYASVTNTGGQSSVMLRILKGNRRLVVARHRLRGLQYTCGLRGRWLPYLRSSSTFRSPELLARQIWLGFLKELYFC